MRAYFIAGLLLLAIGLPACTESPSSPDGVEPLTLVRLRSEPYSFAFNSGLTEPQRLVIRDAAAWEQVWNAIYRHHSSPPARPAIDFQREMVIVAALGERPTGGFSILVETATETTAGVTIGIRSVSPGSRCAVTLAITQPVDIARVTRRNGIVTFAETTQVIDCN